MHYITVFTPTYNRAHLLHRLYQSLKKQTYKNFEWLIIDDGSTDNTEELVSKWRDEDEGVHFAIRFHKQVNKGKCQAINTALDLAAGSLFFTVDSDDYLTDDALEKISIWESKLPREANYAGLVANSGTSPTQTSNPLFKGEYIDASLLSRYDNLSGERAMIFYTEIHRKYRYPYFEGEKFMTEAVVWNRMANDGYQMRFFNDIIWIYEYQDDGLTKSGNSIFLNNPRGYGLWLREKAEFTYASIVDKYRMYYTFTCDLSNKHSPKIISESIGAPYFFVFMIVYLKKLLNSLKRINCDS